MLTTSRLLFVGCALILTAGITYCGDNTTPTTTADMNSVQDMAAPAPDLLKPAPVISAVSPATASNAGGGMLTITGTDFQTGATVTVGGTACANPTVTATQITCTIPAKAQNCAVAAVVVTNPDSK